MVNHIYDHGLRSNCGRTITLNVGGDLGSISIKTELYRPVEYLDIGGKVVALIPLEANGVPNFADSFRKTSEQQLRAVAAYLAQDELSNFRPYSL